jgi:hypothetical protein
MPIPSEINHVPLVAAWVAELQRKPEDVRGISFSCDPQRDLEREKAENSHWKLYRLGNEITVRLIFTDNAIEIRSFGRNEWNSQFKAEE